MPFSRSRSRRFVVEIFLKDYFGFVPLAHRFEKILQLLTIVKMEVVDDVVHPRDQNLVRNQRNLLVHQNVDQGSINFSLNLIILLLLFSYRIDPENVVDQDHHVIVNVVLVHVHVRVIIVERKIRINGLDHAHTQKIAIVVVIVVEKRKKLDIKHEQNFNHFLKNLVLLYVSVIVMCFEKLDTNQ